jgi:hypothetical protein
MVCRDDRTDPVALAPAGGGQLARLALDRDGRGEWWPGPGLESFRAARAARQEVS